MKRFHCLLCGMALVSIVGCSTEVEEGEHVWKDQTRTIEEAKQLEDAMQQNLKQRMEQVGQ